MKHFIIAAISLFLAVTVCFAAGKPKAELSQTTIVTSMHCKACAQKIQENIAFEKGVKDLKIDLDSKTVVITYDSAKTDKDKLCAAIRKLGYTAECRQDKKL